MRYSAVTLVALAFANLQNESSVEAFQHASIGNRLDINVAPRGYGTAIYSRKSRRSSHSEIGSFKDEQYPFSDAGKLDFGRKLQQMGAGAIAATAISFAAVTANPSQLSPTVANAAELSLSRGAIVIELTAPTTNDSSAGGSTTSPTTSPLKKFDASQEQKLLQTLLKNRKELGASIGRIQQSIQNELQVKDSNTGPTAAPIWTEIYQEILSIEGDVVPKVQITPPSDLAATVRDLRSGKLNLLVNGEIINISVEPTFGKDEDDLIIRIKGFKGGILPKETESIPPSAYYGPIRSWLSSFNDFWVFWDSPTSLFTAEGPAFLSGTTNGEVVISGALSAIVLAYVVSYTYYIQQNEAEAAEAAAKQAAIAEKAQKKKVAVETEKKEDTNTVKKKQNKDSEAEERSVENSSPSKSTTQKGKKRRHRFRFWKNRETSNE